DAAGIPDVNAALMARIEGKAVEAPYSLDDMADDAVGLLEALGIRTAHVCGMSMGAYIAQIIAIRHPAPVPGLVSIYGSTGNPELPLPKPEVLQALLAPPPRERAAYVEHQMRVIRAISGPAYPPDEKWYRERAGLAHDRCFWPQGVARQFVAV